MESLYSQSRLYGELRFRRIAKTVALYVVLVSIPVVCLLALATAMTWSKVADAEYANMTAFQAVHHK